MADNNGSTRAPKEGLRYGGKTYRHGDMLPAHYNRIRPAGQLAQDPAKGIDLAPPNFGRPVLPHILTFQGLFTTISKAYRDPDEALKHNRQNALIMRRDCFVMECLEARMRSAALLNWHIDPDDDRSQEQKELALQMTKICQEIHNFTKYRYSLMDAIWFGRQAVQNQYKLDYSTGRKRVLIGGKSDADDGWAPIHGDKLVFRYDDGSGRYDPSQVGVKVIGHYRANDIIGGDRHIEQSSAGMVYFLEPWERSRLVLHRHIIEDAAFEDPLSAGSIHGVGIRSRIYWTWFQMQECLRMMMEFIQRSGRGIWLYTYPTGDAAAEAQMTAIAEQQTDTNVIIMPRTPGIAAGEDGYSVDRVEINASGIENLKQIVHDFFGHRIKRYILGQTLSSESDSTGLGSGVADLHFESLMQIVHFDAIGLEETLTHQLLLPLQHFNFPESRGVKLRFKIDTESTDTKDKLAAVFQAWQMGAKVKSSDVMDLIGFSQPGENDEFLQNPQIAAAQQQAMGTQAQGFTPPAHEGPENGLGADQNHFRPDDTPEDLFGPLAKQATAPSKSAGERPVKFAKVEYRATPGAGLPGGKSKEDAEAPEESQQAANAQHAVTTGNYKVGGGDADAADTEGHQVGDTKEINGKTYALNQNHRWELQDGESAGAPGAPAPHENETEAAGTFEPEAEKQPHSEPAETTEPEHPVAAAFEQAIDQKTAEEGQHPFEEAGKRLFVASQLQKVHPIPGGIMRAFQASPEFHKTGEYVTKQLAPQQAQQAHDWMTQNAGQMVGGGKVVDLGQGRMGFSSPAGAMVIQKGAGGRFTSTYTANTKIVQRARGMDPEHQEFMAQMSDMRSGAPPIAAEHMPEFQGQEPPAGTPGVPSQAIDEQQPNPPPLPGPSVSAGGSASPSAAPAVSGKSSQVVTGHQNPSAQPKAPHEQTRDEFAEGSPAAQHKAHVKKALAEGKTVPPEVLEDYPELQGQQAAPETQQDAEQAAEPDDSAPAVEPDETPPAPEDSAPEPERLSMDPISIAKREFLERRQRGDSHEKARAEAGQAAKTAPGATPAEPAAPEAHPEPLHPTNLSSLIQRAESGGVSPRLAANLKSLQQAHAMHAEAGAAGDSKTARHLSEIISHLSGSIQKEPDLQKLLAPPTDNEQHPTPNTDDGTPPTSPEAGSSTSTIVDKPTDAPSEDDDDEPPPPEPATKPKGPRKPGPALSQLIATKAAEHGIEPHELTEALDYLHSSKTGAVGQREGAKAAARQMTGLNAGDIRRLENQGHDYATDHPKLKGFDTKAREIAAQYPELGMGPGYEGSAGADDHNYAAHLWDILKEGRQAMPSRNDEGLIDEAASLVKSGANLTPEQQKEMELVPFGKDRWAWLVVEYAKHAPSLAERIQSAADETDTSPTPEQKEAGNYRKGRVVMHGLPLSIENPRGSIRSGKDWQITMPHHYGYVRRHGLSEADGDHFDCFVGPNPDSQKVYVVDQYGEGGTKFDEHKAMLGFDSLPDAKRGYLDSYSADWHGLGDVTEMSVEQFRRWMEEGESAKPCAGQQVNYEKSTRRTDYSKQLTDRVIDLMRLSFAKHAPAKNQSSLWGPEDEEKHPRAADGEWTKGEGATKEETPAEEAAPVEPYTEPWQMTRKEFHQQEKGKPGYDPAATNRAYKASLRQAIEDKETVPAEHYGEYADLKELAAEKASEPPTDETPEAPDEIEPASIDTDETEPEDDSPEDDEPDGDDDEPDPDEPDDAPPSTGGAVASPGEIPFATAMRAHEGTSFVPETRAKQRQNEYADYLNSVHAELASLANTPEKQEILSEEFARFKQGYRQKFIAKLHADSRTMSSMITGPARFPVERNRKRMETADRRYQELTEYAEKAIRAMRRKLSPETQPVKSSDENAVETLKKKLAQREKFQEKAKELNKLIRSRVKSVERKGGADYVVEFKPGHTHQSVHDELTAAGFSDRTASESIQPDYMGRVGIPSYSLTNNNAQMKRLRDRIEEVSKMQSSSGLEEQWGNVTLRENPDIGRIQLEFPGKPDASARQQLKRAGFRWSPSEGAWQRHLNNGGRYAAQSVLKALGHAKSDEASDPDDTED